MPYQSTMRTLLRFAVAAAVSIASIAGCSSSPTFFTQPTDAAVDPDAGSPDVAFYPSDGATGGECHHSTLTVYGLGADGVAGTSDDPAGGATEYDFEPGKSDSFIVGATIRIKNQRAGDVFQSWHYGPSGNRERVVQHGKGPDGTFGTPDDPVLSLNLFETGPSGALTKGIYYGEPGADGIYETADDVAIFAWRYRTTGTTIDVAIFSNGAGPDKKWATDDDLVANAIRFEVANGRVMERTIAKVPGPDGQWGTLDDPTSMRMTYPCRGDDVIVETFDGPGPDGVWRTSDDHLSQYAVESGDRCMRAQCGVVYPW